jgi:hypothetical protein
MSIESSEIMEELRIVVRDQGLIRSDGLSEALERNSVRLDAPTSCGRINRLSSW